MAEVISDLSPNFDFLRLLQILKVKYIENLGKLKFCWYRFKQFFRAKLKSEFAI